MLSYLASGWFCPTEPTHLRAEVLDGAWDSAGLLVRAGVPVAVLFALQRLLRRHEPQEAHAPGQAQPSQHNYLESGAPVQALIRAHVADCTDGHPALQGFMMDCLDAAPDSASWRGLCAHLGHIGLTMSVLSAARTAKTDAASLTSLGAIPNPLIHLRTAQS